MFKMLEKCSQLNNDEIDNQITALEINCNQLTGTTAYQLQVHISRCKELTLHARVLEKQIDHYKDQHNVFQMTIKELEVYKNKADMSKELGTFYHPFT